METKTDTTSASLSEREREFCIQYSLTLNGSEAARRAGYSVHTARQAAARLRAKPAIREYCDELVAARRAEAQVSADSIIGRLDYLATLCSTLVPVTDKSGRAIAEKPMDAPSALRALELLGKTIGLFVDRQEQVFDGEITLSWEAMDSTAVEPGAQIETDWPDSEGKPERIEPPSGESVDRVAPVRRTRDDVEDTGCGGRDIPPSRTPPGAETPLGEVIVWP